MPFNKGDNKKMEHEYQDNITNALLEYGWVCLTETYMEIAYKKKLETLSRGIIVFTFYNSENEHNCKINFAEE